MVFLAAVRTHHSCPSLSLKSIFHQHTHQTTVSAHSVRVRDKGSGISYSGRNPLLEPREVYECLRVSTTCHAPNLLRGSMAELSRERHEGAGLSKIETGLQNSSAFVAAFAERVELYENPTAIDQASGPPRQTPSWLHHLSSATTAQPRSLIGLARATSDESLVATIHEVCVHPKYRGRGIGQRLVHLLLRHVLDKGIYDIGAVAPAEMQGFYTALGFEKDRENSTVMKLLGDASQVQTQFAGDTRMQFLSQPQEFDPAKASPMLQFQEQGSTHMSTLQLSPKALQHLESILVNKLDLRRQGH